MTRVPSDDPENIAPVRMAERLAGALRHQVLVAAQVSLRALREMLAHFPAADAHRPTRLPAAKSAAPSPAERPRTGSATTPAVHGSFAATPPTADLLRNDAPLPDSYGSNRLVLLARDPHCLYAYWDLAAAHEELVRTEAGPAALRVVLRTYDATPIAFDATPPARFQDFAVVGNARSVYAYVGKPAACFVAEVGYLRPDGTFFPLARSQPVWTPRTEQPGTGPGQWMTVGWSERRDGGKVVPLQTEGPMPSELEIAERAAATRQAPSSWPGPAPSAVQRGSWSLVRGGRTPAADALTET